MTVHTKASSRAGSDPTTATINARELVRQVFKNFLGKNKDGTGADVLGTLSVFQDDYWVPKQGQLGGVGDGKTPLCSLEKDGKTGTACHYKNVKTPAMHYCDKVGDRGDLAALTADNCGSLGDIMNTDRMTRQFIGVNVLHVHVSHFL